METEQGFEGYPVVVIPTTGKKLIGARAKERRLGLDRNPTDLARMVGVTAQTLLRWESGGVPSRMWEHKLADWAQALNSSPNWLLDGVPTSVVVETRKTPPYAADRSNNTFALSPAQREEIGERAAARRRCLGLSLKEVAAGVGIQWQRIRTWETGGLPRLVNASAFSAWERALFVPIGWLQLHEKSNGALHEKASIRIRLNAADFYEAVKKIGIVLSRSAYDPFWETTPLDDRQRRSRDLFACRYGDESKPLRDLTVASAGFRISRRHAERLVEVMCMRAKRYVFLVILTESGRAHESHFSVDPSRGVVAKASAPPQ